MLRDLQKRWGHPHFGFHNVDTTAETAHHLESARWNFLDNGTHNTPICKRKKGTWRNSPSLVAYCLHSLSTSKLHHFCSPSFQAALNSAAKPFSSLQTWETENRQGMPWTNSISLSSWLLENCKKKKSFNEFPAQAIKICPLHAKGK